MTKLNYCENLWKIKIKFLYKNPDLRCYNEELD